MITLIGLTGPAGCGKNTLGGCADQIFEFSTEFKARLSTILPAEYNLTNPGLPRDKKEVCRPLMVAYGELIRAICGQDYWVKITMGRVGKAILGHDTDQKFLFAITDVRKTIEASAIKAAGGYIIKITRPGVAPANALEAQWLSDLDASGLVDFTYDNISKAEDAPLLFLKALAARGLFSR